MMGPGNTFVFGKQRPFIDGVIGEYKSLHIGSDLSEHARRALKHLCASFKWNGVTGLEKWDPVTAIQVFDKVNRAVVCRILDDGFDNANRPHLLRFEGIELQWEDSENCKDIIVTWLYQRDWSIDDPHYNVVIKNSTVPAQSNELLLIYNPGTWFFIGNRSSFSFPMEARDTEKLPTNEGPNPNNKKVGEKLIPPGPKETDPPAKAPNGKIVAFLELFIIIVLAGLLINTKNEKSRVDKKLEEVNKEKTDQINTKNNEIKELNKKIIKQSGEIQKMEKENEDLKKNADSTLRQENEKLKKEKNTILDLLKEIVIKIEQGKLDRKNK